ncbi:MAG TPA: hypothetical protein VG452_04380 [Egibacteraceae bacterium]|nr:hypothetical protein [Actinomycetota bacterium]HWB71433.1 hypothetical protein [Egibacteraceae bacterium]
MAAEIWGLCRACNRWFYCERWFDKTAPAPTCPGCGSDPSAIENRAAHQVVLADA